MTHPHSFRLSFYLPCLLLAWFSGAAPALAQETDPAWKASNFAGAWQVGPGGDRESDYYVIIKKDQRASWFWGSKSDTTIHYGTWEARDPDTLVIDWENGRRDVLSRTASGFVTRAYSGNLESPGNLIWEAKTLRVPENVIGSWAVPPGEVGNRSTAEREAEGFFGTWEMTREDGTTYYVIVQDDRTAGSSYDGTGKGAEGLRGVWRRRGDELHITWDTGHFEIIRQQEFDYDSTLFEPGAFLGRLENGTAADASRVEWTAPGIWLTDYEEERERYERASLFPKRSEAYKFYRGDWQVVDGDRIVETVELKRFNDADSDRGGNMDGQWRLSGQDVYLVWDDGIRATIENIHRSFVIKLFSPGQPLDGTPQKIFPLEPVDEEKFEKLEELKLEASERMRRFRERQENLPGRGGDNQRSWLNFWPFNMGG
ncbi:MAG: hypothetical protein ACFE0O_12920 [Opitutales bacterium]